MTITTIPPTYYQIAWNADPNQATIPPYWTDQSWRAQFPWSSERGRQYELDAVETGQWRPTLANPDGALDPSNTAGAYYPNVLPFRQARIQCKPGPNALTPDQATAGEASGYPPGITAPAQMNISNDFGYTVTLQTTGTAYQGSQVYQVTLPASSTQFTTILLAKPVPVTPGATYCFSAQVRINSGTTTATSATILWYDANGNSLTPVTGSPVTPTSGSSTWLQVSATGAAPTTAYSAALKIQIASGASTAAPTVWQADGLQFELSAFPTPFQVPFTPSANLLPENLASGGYAAQTATGWWYPAAGSVAYATGLTAAPTGHTTAFAWTTPSGTTSSSPLLAGAAASGPVADIVQVTGSTAYSASFYALRATSADVTLAVTATITWYGSAATSLGTSVGSPLTLATGSWGRLTVSGTSPAGALWGRIQVAITTPASTTASNTVYLTGGQFEAAASPSSWVDPGPTYSVITPFVERWPQTWSEQDGTYGTSDVIGDDAFAALAQYTLGEPFVEEVLSYGASFLYQLNEAAGASAVVDSAGRRVPAPVEVSPFGAGSLVFGTSVTSTNIGSAFIGTPGPVATFNNNPANTPQLAQTFISLHKTTLTPGPPTSGGWTRMIAFRCSSIPASGTFPTLWNANTPSWGSNQSLVQFYIDPTTGDLVVQLTGPTGTNAVATTASGVCDGNWHLAMAVFEGNGYFDAYLDGVRFYHDNNGGAGYLTATGIITDVLGCSITPGASNYSLGFVGDVAHATQFPLALTQAQATSLYQSWRTASQGESTGARIQRILRWIGWSGPSAIDTGQTTSMGPATDLTGATALDAANNVTLTENGNWFTAANGTLTFKSRTARYNQLTPTYIFGENTALGEWPFENPFQFDDDPSHIANNAQVTQYGGAMYTALNSTSSGRFFPRVYQRTINTTSTAECQDAANYLLSRYKDAHMRVSALRLHVTAVPGLFRVCLSLELGTRIRVNRRPNGAPAITFNGFVEKIEWEWDPEQSDVFVNLQCSPADLASYWLLAALRTTLNTQANSGQAQATINALPDAYVNTLSQSLPQGYQLTFEPGTARQETMTLSPSGIPFTGVGYQTAQLTFTSNFAFTHPAGSTVCEPLPSGYTDPTTWDAASVLGAASCTVSGAQSSGTPNLTITGLGDAAVNALPSDWATGDVIWIGPGTANFEGYNRLHPNVSTAGEGVLPLPTGTFGYTVGLFSAYNGNALQVTASGSAFQGSQVWQVTVPGASATGQDLVSALKLQCAPGLSFTGSFYVRSATSSQNPQVTPYIQWYDAYYNVVGSTTTGSTVTLTGSPTASWTRVTATATAPAGAVFARIGVTLTSAPAGSWAFQTDALQFEQAASASTYQTAPQIKSAGSSFPGYTTTTITLAQNLVNNHANGEIVCDPLPPGVTAPTAVAATTRVAY